MIPKMHVIPWDPKALKQEVAQIVRSFSGKDESLHHQKGEKMVPTMHVTPSDRKALRQESERIVRSFFTKEPIHSLREK